MSKNKRILIVDDEKNIRLMISRALESYQAEIGIAVNGEEALKKIEERDYGVILLDLKMPGMEGMEVLRRIRAIRPDIKIIIVTAYGTVDSAVEAMKLGAVDYIQKPFAPKEIRELVGKVWDREELDERTAADYDSFIELAKRSINQRYFDAAVEHVKKAISVDPTRPEAFNLLGILMEVHNDYAEAQEQYRAALALDPTYEPAQKNLNRLTRKRWDDGVDLGGKGESPKGKK
jgi:DNA-binding response OmpR family regulator